MASSLAHRVASNYRQILAKAKYLKAIDFTIGLIHRVMKLGVKLPSPGAQEILKRLINMRALSQKGLDLSTLVENKSIVHGTGAKFLNGIEAMETRVVPSEQHLAAFIKPFPNKADSGQNVQAAKLIAKIASNLGEDASVVEEKLITDAEFFNAAYSVIVGDLLQTKAEAASAVSGLGGLVEKREKKADSIWGKQGRERMSMVRFKDLVGVRVVAEDVKSMAAIAAAAQGSLNVLQKKNYYLENKGYNAINYVLSSSSDILIEFQLKTEVNAIEAALSHDLIYAPEKAVLTLSDQEKNLVQKVIETSTQLTMADWRDAFALEGIRLASYL